MSNDEGAAWGTPQARWILLATVLGSGIAFLDATVVNIALPCDWHRSRRERRRPAVDPHGGG
jgi:hypothetical protein